MSDEGDRRVGTGERGLRVERVKDVFEVIDRSAVHDVEPVVAAFARQARKIAEMIRRQLALVPLQRLAGERAEILEAEIARGRLVVISGDGFDTALEQGRAALVRARPVADDIAEAHYR